MERNVVDEINDKTDIVALISSYVKLERRGKNYFGLCPFHDDTNPSMSVSPEKNIFKCFSCGVGGGPINFYQQINHTTFPQALAALAEPLGIEVQASKKETTPTLIEHDILEEVNNFYQYYLKNSQSGEKAIEYLKKRKLSLETIEHFKIGFSPREDSLHKLLKKKNFEDEQMISSGIITLRNGEYKDFFNNRIMFPITNVAGKVVAFSGRTIDGREPKYYNSAETVAFKKGEVLYHLYEALGEIRKQDHVIIHEGFFDCIASYEAGLKNTIATMGTSLTMAQAKLLENYTKRVVIAFDGDRAGINAAIKAIDVLSKTKLRIDVLQFEKGLDPDDYFRKFGKEKYLNLYKSNLKDQYEFIYTTTKASLDLKNTNDMSILKDATTEMLKRAAQPIKELYLKRLSNDLNVSKDSLTDVLRGAKRSQVVRPPRQTKRKRSLKQKYYRAELFLLLAMFQDKETANRIDQSLGTKYVCDIEVFKLRTILQFKYYSHYDRFDPDLFKEVVSEETDGELLLGRLNEIYNMLQFTNNFTLTDKYIDENIEMLKEVILAKEYNEVLKDIAKESESYQKTIILEKQKKYKLKLTDKGIKI